MTVTNLTEAAEFIRNAHFDLNAANFDPADQSLWPSSAVCRMCSAIVSFDVAPARDSDPARFARRHFAWHESEAS